MARNGIMQKLENIKPEQVFEAGKATFNELGMEIYKMRPFAFLVQARITGDEGLINANIIASPFSNELNLTVKSDTASQETVDATAQKIFSSLEKHLYN
ncbi:MAG: hypothetical protein Q7J07_02685 [Pelolinea sp.]|nr:hypothetical protein [Pelolinea sp.]